MRVLGLRRAAWAWTIWTLDVWLPACRTHYATLWDPAPRIPALHQPHSLRASAAVVVNSYKLEVRTFSRGAAFPSFQPPRVFGSVFNVKVEQAFAQAKKDSLQMVHSLHKHRLLLPALLASTAHLQNLCFSSLWMAKRSMMLARH